MLTWAEIKRQIESHIVISDDTLLSYFEVSQERGHINIYAIDHKNEVLIDISALVSEGELKRHF